MSITTGRETVPHLLTGSVRIGASGHAPSLVALNTRSEEIFLSEQVRCLVVDGHPLVGEGVRRLLADAYEVDEAQSRDEAIEMVRDVGSYDIAIIDMRPARSGAGPSISGSDAIRAISKAEPSTGIIALGDHAERHVATAALQAGASAYVTRGARTETLLEAVRHTLRDKEYVDPSVPPKGSRGRLTRRQRQILQLLADGESTTVAASVLGLSEETVKTHTKNIFTRLGARNRAHAVALGLRQGLIE